MKREVNQGILIETLLCAKECNEQGFTVFEMLAKRMNTDVHWRPQTSEVWSEAQELYPDESISIRRYDGINDSSEILVYTAMADPQYFVGFVAAHECIHWILSHTEEQRILYGDKNSDEEIEAGYGALVILAKARASISNIYDSPIPWERLTALAVHYLPALFDTPDDVIEELNRIDYLAKPYGV